MGSRTTTLHYTQGGDTGSLNLPGVNPQALTNQGGNIPYNQLTTAAKN